MVHLSDWILTDTMRLKKCIHCSSHSLSCEQLIFPFIGKVKKSLSHLFKRQLFFYFPATTFVWMPKCRGCWKEAPLSVHHVWVVLCPRAHICNPGMLQSISLLWCGRRRRTWRDGTLVTQIWWQTGFFGHWWWMEVGCTWCFFLRGGGSSSSTIQRVG